MIYCPFSEIPEFLWYTYTIVLTHTQSYIHTHWRRGCGALVRTPRQGGGRFFYRRQAVDDASVPQNAGVVCLMPCVRTCSRRTKRYLVRWLCVRKPTRYVPGLSTARMWNSFRGRSNFGGVGAFVHKTMGKTRRVCVGRREGVLFVCANAYIYTHTHTYNHTRYCGRFNIPADLNASSSSRTQTGLPAAFAPRTHARMNLLVAWRGRRHRCAGPPANQACAITKLRPTHAHRTHTNRTPTHNPSQTAQC